jgi:hypothetical protein
LQSPAKASKPTRPPGAQQLIAADNPGGRLFYNMIFKFKSRRQKDLEAVCRTLVKANALGLDRALGDVLVKALGSAIEPGEDVFAALARIQGITRDQTFTFVTAVAAGMPKHIALVALAAKGAS